MRSEWFSSTTSSPKRSNSSNNLWSLVEQEEDSNPQKPEKVMVRRINSTGDEHQHKHRQPQQQNWHQPHPDLSLSPRQRRHTTLSSSDNSQPSVHTKAKLPRAKSNPPSRSKSPKRSLVRKLSNSRLVLSPNGKDKGSPSKSPSGIKVANDMLRASVMAPVNIAAWTGKAVVGASRHTGQGLLNAGDKMGQAVVHASTVASTAVVNTGSIATHAVVDAGSTVGNSVVSGSKAIIGGTTNTVVHGGKSMVKGSVKLVGAGSALTSKAVKPLGRTSWGVVKGLKQASIRGFAQSYKVKKSKWEEGIEAIEELLNPDCAAFQHMTLEQRQSLQAVKKLLVKGTTTSQAAKMQHVPAELILMQSAHGSNFDPSLAPLDESMSMASMAFSDVHSSGSTAGADTAITPERRQSMHRSSTFILQEYAGVKEDKRRMDCACNNLDAVGEDEEVEHIPSSSSRSRSRTASPPPTFTSSRRKAAPPRVERTLRTMDSPTASLTDISDEPLTDASEGSSSNNAAGMSNKLPPKTKLPPLDLSFVPPEFTYMDHAQQVQVYQILKLDSINQWSFNIFELDEITNGHSMLFVGWAILAAPYAQHSMAKELGLTLDVCCDDGGGGYQFLQELQIPPQKLYNFIKVIEQDYNPKNPYHCATHGADVLQSLHTLIQMSSDQEFMKTCSKLQLFSILLSALVHDVGHFGTTNAYHCKLQTELAVVYNDKSVMENWHVAHAFSRMFGMDLTQPYNIPAKDVKFSKFQQFHDSECNLLCNATPEQFLLIRKLMIDAILHTDMTNHFEMVNAARGLLMEQEDEETDSVTQEDYTWRTLLFMLHLADISGQAKGGVLCHGWTKRCFEEFFAQGDKEAALGLPVSPNCDRYKVMISESQVGFIKFVVEPAFEVLGNYIPFVQETVLPIIHENMMFYLSQQQEVDAAIEKEASEEFLSRLSTLKESTTSSREGSMNMSRIIETTPTMLEEHQPKRVSC